MAAMPTATDPRQVLWTQRQRYEQMRGLLRLERQSFVEQWRELAAYVLPGRGRFTAFDTNKGTKRTSQLIDGTPAKAARTLAAGMMSGVTSPARPWFRLTVPDYALGERADVRGWLDEVADRMRKVLLRSNLYKVLPICYGDLGVFGTHALGCFEDDEQIVRFYPFPVGSYYLANDAKGRVRVFCREFRLTVRQLVERFVPTSASGVRDWSVCSPMVRTAWERNERERWVDVVHVIEPNDAFDPTKLHSRFKRFRAVYYELGLQRATGEAQTTDLGERFLEEKGFDEFPIFAPRWEVAGEDVYGTTCPGMVALGDIKELQHAAKKHAKALDKMIDPPLVGPSAAQKARVSLLPGDVTYADETTDKRLRPIHEVNLRLDFLNQHRADLRSRISEAMFADLFLMMQQEDELRPAGSPRTATEINERHEEKLLALGPMLENLNQELLDPLVDRVFNILLRRGMLPEPPEALQGQPLDVEYISVMAQAQKLVGLGGIERLAGFVGNVATTTQDPSIWDKVDTDQLVDEYADAAGVPSRLVRPDDVVAQIRAARQQQVAAQQQAALAQQASMAARNLSQTDTSGKNALTDLLGLQGAA